MQTLMLRTSVLERLCGPLCDAVLEQRRLRRAAGRALADEPVPRPARRPRRVVPLPPPLRAAAAGRARASRARPRADAAPPRVCLASRSRLDRRGDPARGRSRRVRRGRRADRSRVGRLRERRSARHGARLARAVPARAAARATRGFCSSRRGCSRSAGKREAAADGDRGGRAAGAARRRAAARRLQLARGEPGDAARAAIPWGDIGAGLENARRAAELEGRVALATRRLLARSAAGLYFSGELDEADRWLAESAALAPAREQWLSPRRRWPTARRRGRAGRLDEQELLADEAADLAREHGLEEVVGEVLVALGVSLAARGEPDEALPLFERGVGSFAPLAIRSSWRCADPPGDRAPGPGPARGRGRAIAEARAVLDSCPDPGILAGVARCARAAAADPPPKRRRSAQRPELVILRMLTATCPSATSAASSTSRTTRSTATRGRSTASSASPRAERRSRTRSDTRPAYRWALAGVERRRTRSST